MVSRLTEWRSTLLQVNDKELTLNLQDSSTQSDANDPPLTVNQDVQTDMTLVDLDDLEAQLLLSEQKVSRLSVSKAPPSRMQVAFRVESLRFMTQDIADIIANSIWLEIRIEGPRPYAAGRTHATSRKGLTVTWNDTLKLLVPSEEDKDSQMEVFITAWTTVFVNEQFKPVAIAQFDDMLSTSDTGREIVMRPDSVRLYLGSVVATMLP